MIKILCDLSGKDITQEGQYTVYVSYERDGEAKRSALVPLVISGEEYVALKEYFSIRAGKDA